MSADFLTASGGSQDYDINNIINKINAETNRRYTGSSGNPGVIPQKSKGNVADNATIDTIIDRINHLNSIHCYCQNHTMESRSPGSAVTVNSIKSDFEENVDFLDDVPRDVLQADVERLQAQCACNTFVDAICDCNTHYCSCQSACDCNTNVDQCNTHGICPTHCSCNLYLDPCSTHIVCTCNTEYCAFNAEYGSCGCYSVCSCNSHSCSCDSDNCSCDSHSCGCESVNCSCDSHVCYCEGHTGGCGCQIDACTCEGNNCSCDSHSCGCEGDNCSCNTHSCSENTCVETQCTCHFDYSTGPVYGPCGSHNECPSNCVCHYNNVACGSHCECDYDCYCDNDCGCDTHCACDNDCTCDSQCFCEFN